MAMGVSWTRLSYLLATLTAFAACGEEDASLKLDAAVSPSTTADGGARGDGGNGGRDGGTSAPPSAGANVKIDDGELNGSMQGSIRRFLGIPYAKPPVGELRWKRPEKPAKWSAPRDATKWGKRCAQLNSATLMNPPSED